MLQIDPIELANRLQRPGGTDWVAFMDNLLWAACWQVGIPESAVRTNLRTDRKDGGVDTRISEGSDRDLTGYLQTPSIWQYKAAHESNLRQSELLAEVNKPYARERILAGDAYRLCLAAQLPDRERTQLETALAAAVAEIKPDGPAPVVLTVDIVARIASHFPGFLQEYRGLEFQSRTFTFRAWGKNITARTPTFVPGQAFESLKTRVAEHVDPQIIPERVLLIVRGMAATGKTRSVYEALKSLNASSSLILYADDASQAVEFSRILANTERMSGILVVDDISLEARHQLNEALAGHKDRIRVIAIQHETDSEGGESVGQQFVRYTQDEIGPILAANFKEIAPERLRAYVELSEGYLRFAIDLCRHDHEIRQEQGKVIPNIPEVMSYYRILLGTDADYVDCLALFTRVGRESDVSKELDELCARFGFDRRTFEQRCNELKEAPGFVERSAIYYRIRPAIVAKHAFSMAWKKWVDGKETDFLTWIQKLPKDMQVSFMARVNRSAGDREREIVRNFFQTFASSLRSADLSNPEKVSRMIALVEIDPGHYLPQLRRLVETASDNEIKVERRGLFIWGSRRQLVFSAEKMAHFTAHFHDAERILFRLSQVEIEPTIGNNASGVWERLFRPLSSGTPIPFAERVRLLRTRLPEPEKTLQPVFERALEKTFDYFGSGSRTTVIIAGRIPEQQWSFRNHEEQEECIALSLQLLSELAETRSQSPDAAKTYRLLIKATEMFVHHGFLNIVEQEVRVANLPERVCADLHTRLDRYATRSGIYSQIPQHLLPDEYAETIITWLSSFQTTTLLGRVIQTVGRVPTWPTDENDEQGPLAALALEFMNLHRSSPQEVRGVIDWAYSGDVPGAFQFGFQVGKADMSGVLLQLLVDQAVTSGQPEFTRGYLAGSVVQGVLNTTQFNSLLDGFQQGRPEIAFLLAHAIADVADAFGRTLELLRSGSLPSRYLENFTVWIGSRRTTQEDARRALEILMPMIRSGQPGCATVAVDFVAYQYERSADPEWKASRDSSFDQLTWEVLEVAVDERDMHSHWWGETLKHLAPTSDPVRVAGLLVAAMCGDNFHLREEADKLLSEFAGTNPEIAMDALGEMMQDEDKRQYFHAGKLSCFLALPPEVLGGWLDQHGVEGALTVAHHIPAPRLNERKEQDLHPLTELFLGKYASEDRVFNEYAGQLHSLQSYMGDISKLKEDEAEVARKFLNHELPRVRDWATYEINDSTREAAQHRALLDRHKD
jgi:hypothetical protein